MAVFNATSQIFAYMDTVVSQFVATNLSNVISFAAPLAGIGLTMALMIEGLFLMGRPNGEPLGTLVNRFVKYAIIISIASAGGWYQTRLADAAMKVPDDFASVFVINGQSGAAAQDTIASTIDLALDNGLTVARTAFDNAGVMSGPGLASLVLGITVLIVTALMCGIGAGLILMSKVMLGIVVCFGPAFIFLLLFESTKALFTKWIGSVINYGLVTVLFSAVFGVLMYFFKAAIASAAKSNPDAPILVAVVTCGLLCVISYFILKEIPHMASSWGQGVCADIFNHFPGRSGQDEREGRGGQEGGGMRSDTPSGGAPSGGTPGQGATPDGRAAQLTQTATYGYARGSRR